MNDCERRKCQYWDVDHCSDTVVFFNNEDQCCRYHLNAVARDYDKERMDRIEEVWQKYKGMDKILTTNNQISYLQDRIAINVLYDLWQAIRRDE